MTDQRCRCGSDKMRDEYLSEDRDGVTGRITFCLDCGRIDTASIPMPGPGAKFPMIPKGTFEAAAKRLMREHHASLPELSTGDKEPPC